MSSDQTRSDELARLLAWSQHMGADAVVAEDATDWLARGPIAPGAEFSLAVAGQQSAVETPDQGAAVPVPQLRPPAMPAVSRPASPPPAAKPPLIKPAARPSTIEAASLTELEAKLRAFEGCGLKANATNLCFYRGAPVAPLMIIGEAPGREEDLEGRPFVGRAGQLLDKMLAAIGFSEPQVHITNIVYWRPPGNRTPSPQEAFACRPFLDRQIALVNPKVILLLGGTAAKQILETEEPIMRLRGTWAEPVLGGRTVKTMATLHPAYLFRTPAAKRQVWRDLLLVSEHLKQG